ncbi:LysM peptidoglycan-binding domain-containing protein [Candidatus Saccharibacteria bacterium]|nr:LysM peptidoglycan-binding domain-containing protein [Candidatus Saccharibacteria bacterium]
MSKRKKKFDIKKIRQFLPYFLTGAITLVLVFVGSIDKKNAGATLSLDSFAENDYKVSVDQLSELYVVADLSDAIGLASASDVASNYVVTVSMYDAGQTSTGKIEKPTITDVDILRGVIVHIVKEGETMESIAASVGKGVTTDDIRWSNDMKDTDVSVGDTLYVPSAHGIVYIVEDDDTADSIAEKYGSTATEILHLNDLETTGLVAGRPIFIKGGTLPETERPEYEPPVVTYYYYTYLGNTASRQDIEVIGWFYGLGGPYAAGQCTQWAWYMWQQNGRDVPTSWGNAYSWGANAAAQGYQVDHYPAAGAIFQSSSGWYGHVGYVEAVNSDGSIVASEMNYNYQPFRAIRSTIPAASAASLWYIH